MGIRYVIYGGNRMSTVAYDSIAIYERGCLHLCVRSFVVVVEEELYDVYLKSCYVIYKKFKSVCVFSKAIVKLVNSIFRQTCRSSSYKAIFLWDSYLQW
jgi:hypothetical protein